MKKKTCTVEDYKKISSELYPVRNATLSLACKMSRLFPHNTKPCKLADKIYAAVEDLRNELDNVLFMENPDLGDRAKRIYYGPDDSVRAGRTPLTDRKGAIWKPEKS